MGHSLECRIKDKKDIQLEGIGHLLLLNTNHNGQIIKVVLENVSVLAQCNSFASRIIREVIGIDTLPKLKGY